MIEIKWRKAELNTERATYGNVSLKKVKVGNVYSYHIIKEGETVFNTLDHFEFLRRLTGHPSQRLVSDEVMTMILKGESQ